ncbi:MAG TPA: DUF2226 domain-containing protein [Methanothermococcus okinawensis]|nr:DUF2226 domain-containing protein [Methanothermococcus okinawensis]
MVVHVIEGNLIKIVEDEDVDKILKELKNFTGYIKLSIKKDRGFEEGYIFLKNGAVIGYYYNNNNTEAFGDRAVEHIEDMKKEKSLIEVYEYTLEKLNTMMDVYKEIFLKEVEIPKKEGESTEFEEDLHYYNLVLRIPEGKPLKVNVGKNYKDYLKGYTLVEIFKKDGGEYKKGYVIYKDKTPILSAYESNNKVLFGKDACLMIKKLLTYQDIVVDIFEYNEDKVEVLIEYYPQMVLIDVESLREDEKVIQDEMEDIKEGINEEIVLNKEELLKKLNVTLPDEESIENLIKSTFEPSSEELESIKKDLEEKIYSYLENRRDIESFNVGMDVYYNGRYHCTCNIKIKPKSIFKLILYRGRLFKNIDAEKIKKDIEYIISQYVIDINPKVNVEIV